MKGRGNFVEKGSELVVGVGVAGKDKNAGAESPQKPNLLLPSIKSPEILNTTAIRNNAKSTLLPPKTKAALTIDPPKGHDLSRIFIRNGSNVRGRAVRWDDKLELKNTAHSKPLDRAVNQKNGKILFSLDEKTGATTSSKNYDALHEHLNTRSTVNGGEISN